MRQWTSTPSRSARALGPGQMQSLRDSPEMAFTRAELLTILSFVLTDEGLRTGKRVKKWAGPCQSSTSLALSSLTAPLARAFSISSL